MIKSVKIRNFVGSSRIFATLIFQTSYFETTSDAGCSRLAQTIWKR